MDVFEAVADPTRRRILEMASECERSVSELTAEFAMSGPAVSRHLRVLRDAGMVECRRHGNRRMYRLRPESLDEVNSWVESTKQLWTRRLDALATHLDNVAANEVAANEAAPMLGEE